MAVIDFTLGAIAGMLATAAVFAIMEIIYRKWD
jgi:preprotein translocase subunit SecD